MSIEINIIDKATPRLLQLKRKLTPKRLGAVVGPPCRELVRNHLNKNGAITQQLDELCANR